MGTKTKTFSSAQPGAPVLSGTAGSLIAILDAVLVDGFGLQTATSVTITAGVATVNVASTPSAVVNSVILIEGATPVGLNGEHRVTAITSNSVSFVTAETGVVSGTVTMKMAPAGWGKAFTGTNLAAYKIIDVAGSGCYLRVDDTGTTGARVLGYETMADINTGQGAFPSATQWASPGLWWSKSSAANTTPRDWYVFADSAGVYFFPAPHIGSQAHNSYFGDALSLRTGDNYRCFLRAYTTNAAGNASLNGSELTHTDPGMTYGGLYFARAANAVGGSVQSWNAETLAMGTWHGAHGIGNSGATYPSLTDNGLMLTRIVLFTSTAIRGYYPGVYGTPQNVLLSFSMGDIIEGTGDMVGRKLQVVKAGSSINGQSCVFMDVLSDWR